MKTRRFFKPTSLRLTVAACALVVVGLAFALQALVLVEGSAKVLTFQRMKRVVIVDPKVADVVVASLSELVIMAKSQGHTKLYVWDAHGRHEYSITVRALPSSTALVRRLRDLLPATIEARALGDKLILLHGTFNTKRDHDRALALVKGIADGVSILDMTSIKGEQLSPAERAADRLRQLYGDKLQYFVWGEKTVIVRGEIDDRLKQEIDALNSAIGGDVRIAVVQAAPAAKPFPVDRIAQAIGTNYRVWLLGPRTVVVEGQAATEAEYRRVTELLKALGKQAEIVNLVEPAPKPKPPISRFVELINGALGDKITARAIGDNTIALEGTVPSKDELKPITELVQAVAQGVRVVNFVRVVSPEKRQIAIHIHVVDLNRDRAKRYGAEWGQVVNGGFQEQPILVRVEKGVDNLYDLATNLQALEENKEARILAKPTIVVNDGEEASILVGGEIPIPVAQPGSSGFTTITVEYKEYGVNLRVKPTITPAGKIMTKVEPEVSSIDYASGVTIAGLTIPGLRTRRASTTVTVPSGATIVIGGLIRSDQSKLVKKIPLLANLPIIGELFKHREFKEGKSELVIFLTPEILKQVEAPKKKAK